jgi:hypothetical protein
MVISNFDSKSRMGSRTSQRASEWSRDKKFHIRGSYVLGFPRSLELSGIVPGYSRRFWRASSGPTCPKQDHMGQGGAVRPTWARRTSPPGPVGQSQGIRPYP